MINFTRAKKGLFFHLTVLGILFAIGLFLAFTKSYTVQQEPLGQWHLNLISKVLQPAEIDLLELDQQARQAGWEVALLLAKQGGFADDSECGKVAGRNLWNAKDKWCLPVVKEVASNLADQRITQNRVSFDQELLRARGENKIINAPGEKIQRYEYSTSLAVDLAYSFDEYGQLEQEARKLINDCAGKDSECIKSRMPRGWKLCGAEKNVFCVNSQGRYVIQDIPATYEFALDFSG